MPDSPPDDPSGPQKDLGSIGNSGEPERIEPEDVVIDAQVEVIEGADAC
jgi:hypothetical protein